MALDGQECQHDWSTRDGHVDLVGVSTIIPARAPVPWAACPDTRPQNELESDILGRSDRAILKGAGNGSEIVQERDHGFEKRKI
ncbi:hypothetical protein ACROSR_18535 [Roseovarius tibetensis]|uniref:hypothetical protein n=1 Tax=Roseovarius tibetensis TaxID=2685897 RepID=UPI003D7FE256